MTSRVELDLPPAGETLLLSDLERFVNDALQAGAGANTPVLAVAADQYPELTFALRIEFGSVPDRRESTAELLRLLSEIERNDGDIHAQRHAIHELRQRLTGDAR